jgi:hypothetical protein
MCPSPAAGSRTESLTGKPGHPSPSAQRPTQGRRTTIGQSSPRRCSNSTSSRRARVARGGVGNQSSESGGSARRAITAQEPRGMVIMGTYPSEWVAEGRFVTGANSPLCSKRADVRVWRCKPLSETADPR